VKNFGLVFTLLLIGQEKHKSQISEGVKETLFQSEPAVILHCIARILEGVLSADAMYFRSSIKI
jgi:hypothetical protein